ncbi:MAG TPA: cyclic nucleotide-binding domain-containing protein [Chloroflexi bacterium]|nr:cyclic nucleotide-binding domain-containing protein [Chloroflexota bacterium]
MTHDMPDKLEVLRQSFPDMAEEDLETLASVATLRPYPADTILCQEGAVEDTFYLIVRGQAEVTKALDGDVQVVINRPGPGHFVGEIALVHDSPRTATVRTTEPTTVLEIKHQDFVEMLYQSAPLAVRVMMTITPRLRDIDQATIANLRQQNAELKAAYEALERQHRTP